MLADGIYNSYYDTWMRCNMKKNVRPILGTMTFGQQTFLEDAVLMVDYCFHNGCTEFDSAYVYNDGNSERLLGEILCGQRRENYKIATKVNPRITGRLDSEAVYMQLTESLERLRLERVDILYLHFPDRDTPIENALEACAKLYEQGKFLDLGLSNFPAWLVADVYHKCSKYGWMRPKVYEGVYSALSRRVELELFDALNAFDMRFYAYNPLAGGMLTGKYTDYAEAPPQGRFTLRQNYQNRYWKKSFFDAVKVIKKACDTFGVSMVDAAFRWLAFHSKLSGERGDGVIIGASKISQLTQNLNSFSNGDLPNEIVEAINEGAEICKQDAYEYYKYYSK